MPHKKLRACGAVFIRETKIYLPVTHTEERKKQEEEETDQKKTVTKNEGEITTKKNKTKKHKKYSNKMDKFVSLSFIFKPKAT